MRDRFPKADDASAKLKRAAQKAGLPLGAALTGEQWLEWHRHHVSIEPGEPMHYWGAYATARNEHLPIPEWVLRYLDDAAGALIACSLPGNIPTKPAAAIRDALGMNRPGGKAGKSGPWNPFRYLERAQDQLIVAMEVWAAMRAGTPEGKAINSVAHDRGVDRKTVGAYWKTWGAHVRAKAASADAKTSGK